MAENLGVFSLVIWHDQWYSLDEVRRFGYREERTVGMQEVTFTLRTLTPLFLAGADQTKAELRAPTFRGLMRYWQRALVGGLFGTDRKGLEKVSEAETAVFGATDTGSAVSVKVS